MRAGDPVLKLHLWNEHVPPIGPAGSDLAWAVSVRRMLIRSLRAAARWLASELGLANVRAIGGVTVLISAGGEGGDLRLMRRMDSCWASAAMGRRPLTWRTEPSSESSPTKSASSTAWGHACSEAMSTPTAMGRS